MCICCSFRHNAGRESDNWEVDWPAVRQILYGVLYFWGTSYGLTIAISYITTPKFAPIIFYSILTGRIIRYIYINMD